jgi:hypothetical protein
MRLSNEIKYWEKESNDPVPTSNEGTALIATGVTVQPSPAQADELASRGPSPLSPRGKEEPRMDANERQSGRSGSWVFS